MRKTSIVGDVINFCGLVYGPVNEMGVVALFSKISDDIGFIIEEVRAGFPDCIARREIDKGWERVAIEFEYRSSNFRLHGHDPEACDLIVCWQHDWDTCPVPVLSLKQYLADAQAKVSSPLDRVRIAEPPETRICVVTEGGIRRGYVRIGELDDFWPQECIGGSGQPAAKHLIVEFEGVGRATTDIFDRHKSLRSTHTGFKRFFKKHKLQPGDQVEIVRVGRYEYRIRPLKETNNALALGRKAQS